MIDTLYTIFVFSIFAICSLVIVGMGFLSVCFVLSIFKLDKPVNDVTIEDVWGDK